MRCPECNSPNDSQASACNRCGLLLARLAAPKRRTDDLAASRRRAADLARRTDDLAATRRRSVDLAVTPCPFCGGEIEQSAARCRHCSQIVKSEVRIETALRRRAQINYASWVAYIFGLISFFLFKPVGIVAIAAGLLLSIAYYAIPIERAAREGQKKETLWEFLKRQVRLDRIAIPIPHLNGRKLVFVGTPLVAALVGFLANFFLLQQPMNKVLASNPAYEGMSVSAHYRYFFIPGVVVYDLETIGPRQSTLDVHTALLDYAKSLKQRRFRKVELSYQGTQKMAIDGGVFQKLGQEYDRRNFAFVLIDFPKMLRQKSSTRSNEGLGADRDALIEFHRQWYATHEPAGN